MTVVLAESLHPSDRDFSTQVTVDKSTCPQTLLTVARLPLPFGSWPSDQVTVVSGSDFWGQVKLPLSDRGQAVMQGDAAPVEID